MLFLAVALTNMCPNITLRSTGRQSTGRPPLAGSLAQSLAPSVSVALGPRGPGRSVQVHVHLVAGQLVPASLARSLAPGAVAAGEAGVVGGVGEVAADWGGPDAAPVSSAVLVEHGGDAGRRRRMPMLEGDAGHRCRPAMQVAMPDGDAGRWAGSLLLLLVGVGLVQVLRSSWCGWRRAARCLPPRCLPCSRAWSWGGSGCRGSLCRCRRLTGELVLKMETRSEVSA